MPEDSIRTGFSLVGFAVLAENPQAEAGATLILNAAKRKIGRITNHSQFCELVMTWAARKNAARSSTTMRQYTIHSSMAAKLMMSASRPLDVDV